MDEQKEQRLASAFGASFTEVGSTDVEHEITVSVDEATDLIHMGPAGHHSQRQQIHDELRANPVDEVTVAVRVHCYRRI
jgi:hypothetical protein